MSPNLVGQTFGRLTVIARAENTRHGAARWLCHCECGGTATPSTGSLRDGNSTSCGCLREEKLAAIRATFHHQCETPEYRIWTLMRNRCTNPNAPNYARYGGRGVTVCAEWDNFPTFLRDMGPRPSSSHSIDRINNDRPYEPKNCRWATGREQSRNTSRNRIIEHNGERLTLAEWAERAGVNANTLYYRLKRGASMSEAISKPAQHRISPEAPSAR